MKDKDIKMQEMKLALAKMEKEKSKIHEEAQVEADSRKTWESKLEVKDR
jgi:ribosomal protein S8